jgi:hypothetical protein
MAWTLTLDSTTVGMIATALVSAGTALWYVAKTHTSVSAIPRIERQLSRLRSSQVRTDARVSVVWHRLGFSDDTIAAVNDERAGKRPRHVVALELVQAPESEDGPDHEGPTRPQTPARRRR